MITHPLTTNHTVTAMRPSCPCKNPTFDKVTGKIDKVITNHNGIWYYLSIGITIKAEWVTSASLR